ncbi:hypothetical protein [Methylobacterium nigriterrae]|uniref:hypothetical protein n=1 Tax=Methylobacterium nigriterrae TaxID=3127512 RepID=UPI003013FCA1
MKVLWTLAAVGLGLMGSVGPTAAQRYGEPEYGYRERDYGYRDRDDGYRERGPAFRGRDRGYGFDEREYLRCNPDVRRAVERGQMESGAAHYRVFGRREGRRLSC